jgi:hypothetical protein
MPETNRSFRDRLLELEPVTPELKERYQKEIEAMFNKPLTSVQRWSWLVAAIGSAGMAVFFGAAALLAPDEFPLYGRIMFVISAGFAIAWAVLGLRSFKWGSINLKTDTAMYYGMAWALPVIMLTLFMMFAPNNLVGLRMIVCGIVFLIMGAAFLLRGVVERAELQTREKLLEIEYRLAKIEESVKAR